MVDTTDAWITERTGIKVRHVAADDQAASDLAVRASRNALDAAGLGVDDVDCIICATGTGDHVMPSTACLVQTKLGGKPVMAFDVAAACSGFIYALSVADAFVRAGNFRRVLVVGAEVLSRFTDYRDRGTCILFGDGAGAVVLGRAEPGAKQGLLAQHFVADGSQAQNLGIVAGGSRRPTTLVEIEAGTHYLRMNGREVFRSAVRTMAECCARVLGEAGFTAAELDWLIPHQANLRIIETVRERLDLDPAKLVLNLERTGNTSSASIPIALDEAIRDGRVRRGQRLLMTAFGAGITSGAIALRY